MFLVFEYRGYLYRMYEQPSKFQTWNEQDNNWDDIECEFGQTMLTHALVELEQGGRHERS